MGIQEKIDNIRHKPEQVRIRYVWICTSLSMVFVLVIWVFSLITSREPEENQAAGQSTKELLDDLSSQKKSMEDTAGEIGNVMNKAQEQTQKMTIDTENTKNLSEEGIQKPSEEIQDTQLEEDFPVDNQKN